MSGIGDEAIASHDESWSAVDAEPKACKKFLRFNFTFTYYEPDQFHRQASISSITLPRVSVNLKGLPWN